MYVYGAVHECMVGNSESMHQHEAQKQVLRKEQLNPRLFLARVAHVFYRSSLFIFLHSLLIKFHNQESDRLVHTLQK